MHTNTLLAPSLLLAFLAPLSASAEPAAEVQAQAEPSQDLAITLSPAHLALGVVELTGEYRAHDQLGVALVGGAGGFTDDLTVWEAGAQLRWYALGSFRHGLQLGAELLYVHASGDLLLSDDEATASGAALGPFVGYKYAANFGLTVDVQAGAQYLAVAGDDEMDEDADSGVIPLLNLNVGWSF